MRTVLTLAIAISSLAACSSESTAPVATEFAADELESTLVALGMPLAGNPGISELALIQRFPADIKLSAAQHAQIAAITAAFETATRSDREALSGIARQIAEAKRARKPEADIRALVEQTISILQRLAAAQSAVREQILAVLTPAQKAWLTAQAPHRCDLGKFPPLTAAQRSQIHALELSFRQANSADLATVETAMKQAREAKAAGKSEAEIRAIIEAVRPAMDRIAIARRQLAERIAAIYTAEQKASGCTPFP